MLNRRVVMLLCALSCSRGPESPVASGDGTASDIGTNSDETATGIPTAGTAPLDTASSGASKPSDTALESSSTTLDLTGTSMDHNVPPQECETWIDTCPDGMKCLPYTSRGPSEFGAFDTQGCFELVAEPAPSGSNCQPLEAESGQASQLDTCEKGTICWFEVCTPLCQGPFGEWTCPEERGCAPLFPLVICLPTCDPFEPDCAVGEICAPTAYYFACALAADSKGLFDPCGSAIECASGLVCVGSEAAVECSEEVSGCCSSLCKIDAPACSGMGQECVSYYPPGTPGYENLGVCRIPS